MGKQGGKSDKLSQGHFKIQKHSRPSSACFDRGVDYKIVAVGRAKLPRTDVDGAQGEGGHVVNIEGHHAS